MALTNGHRTGEERQHDARIVGHRGARYLSDAHRSRVAAVYPAVMSDSKPFDRTTADVVLAALRRTRSGPRVH